MSPTFTFSSAPLALLDSAVSLSSLSFALTFSMPAFASTDVTSPVTRLVFGFSDFSVFFSVVGAAGVAGVAGVVFFSWAKPMLLKASVVTAMIKTLSAFFTVSPPFDQLDVWICKYFNSPKNLIRSLPSIASRPHFPYMF